MWTPLGCLILLLACLPVFAHDPITTKLTWSKEISRVVYRRCVSCHRPDGPAFSLLTYQDARPWAKGIRDEVLGRRMPPWDAVKGVGEFRDDSGLSLPEIDLIVNWVEGGAPEGDPAYLPDAPPRVPVSLRQSSTGVRVQGVLRSIRLAPSAGFSLRERQRWPWCCRAAVYGGSCGSASFTPSGTVFTGSVPPSGCREVPAC